MSILLIVLVVSILWAWYIVDMRSVVESAKVRNQLEISGRWSDLENFFKAAARTRRPFVWLFHKYLLPGAIPAQYALFLNKRARLEEALEKIDEAIEINEGKPVIFRGIHRQRTFKVLCSALRARALILTGLGRYGEARETAAKIQQLTGTIGKPNPSLALLEYNCGRLDEALMHAQATGPEHSQYDGMRGIVSLVYCMKGDFEKAIQALEYEPSDILKFYGSQQRKIPSEPGTAKPNVEGPTLIELQRQKTAGVFLPAKLLSLANVYLAQEKFEDAVPVLDQAEKLIGSNPGIQLSYHRHRACSCAGQGNATETEGHIKCMRAIVEELPKRSLLWEAHLASGRAYFYLGRFNDALTEITAAEKSALHPLEKHVTAYWMASAHESAGHQSEAVAYYKMVVADTIQSRLGKKAADALAGQEV